MTATWHYDHAQLVAALHAVGIGRGDIVLVHVSLGRLGYPREGASAEAAAANLVAAFQEVLGPEGTLLVPTYTYSIGRQELFDIDQTPSRIGFFTEHFRQLPGVIRSADPMLSTAGLGPRAADLLTGLSHSCYGVGSTFHKLRQAGGKICTVGVSLYFATFRHHIEEMARVPFRFTKLFHGRVRADGQTRDESWEYYAAPFIANCRPNGLPLERLARNAGLVAVAPVGRGEVMCIPAQTYFEFGLAQLQRDPWLTAMGPPCAIDQDALDGAVGEGEATGNE